MYAVIFKAVLNTVDDDYFQTAKNLRELALKKYSCINFDSVYENQNEISISYWHSLEDITSWKQNAEHLIAQKKGREYWYQTYRIEISKIEKEYSFSRNT